jgi:hypothetical protein
MDIVIVVDGISMSMFSLTCRYGPIGADKNVYELTKIPMLDNIAFAATGEGHSVFLKYSNEIYGVGWFVNRMIF